MFSIIRCFQAEWLKSRHTPLLLVHVLFPLIGAGVFAGYFHISGWSEMTNVTTFLEVLAIIFPFVIGIVVGMIVELENGAGHFQLILGTIRSRIAVYIGKLVYLIVLATFATILCIFLFAVLYPVMPFSFYIKPLIMLILWIGSFLLVCFSTLFSILYIIKLNPSRIHGHRYCRKFIICIASYRTWRFYLEIPAVGLGCTIYGLLCFKIC